MPKHTPDYPLIADHGLIGDLQTCALVTTDGTIDWLWPAAERAGLPVALLGPGLLQVIGTIAERHRGLKLCRRSRSFR